MIGCGDNFHPSCFGCNPSKGNLSNFPMAKFLLVLLVLPLFLASCGGGPPPQTSQAKAEAVFQTPAMALSRSGDIRRDIGWDARRDYKEAMVLDCLKGGGSTFTCTPSGRGWFVPWTNWPAGVAFPLGTMTRDEENVIIRAVAIVNRSLPADKRLVLYETPRSLVGYMGIGNSYRRRGQLISGYIHAEILSWGPPQSRAAGIGWTDGDKGYALVHSDEMADPEYAVQTMVHEILHALGLMGHPHHTHTSILSYRHESSEIFDNIPALDVAVLYDMYRWGYWLGRVDTVFDAMDGVQFGVHSFNLGRALIPWVDGGQMGPPHPSKLEGRASYEGKLVGKTTSLAQDVSSVAELGFDLGRNAGDVRFHTIRHWDGRMWNRQGYRYDLHVSGPYFRSSVVDGISDVTGAFYGYYGIVAAGTLQRADLTAAFGASKN